jgi:hypothetical protein
VIVRGWGVAWRRAAAEDRPLAWVFAAGALAALALAPLLPALARFAPPCPLHVWTGVPCPACGSTRAALAFFRGDLAAAFAFNPLATVALAGGLAAGLAAPAWVALRGPVPVLAPVLPSRARMALCAALCANWVWLVWRGV